MSDKPPPAVMSGTLVQLADGCVEGSITDPFGFITVISGVPTGLAGQWAISAVVIVPPDLQIAGFDGLESP